MMTSKFALMMNQRIKIISQKLAIIQTTGAVQAQGLIQIQAQKQDPNLTNLVYQNYLKNRQKIK